jgi:photosystem II stability/assembly factor-like uncharacterized protein
MAMMTTDGGNTWSDWSLHIGDNLSHNLYAVAMHGSDIYLVGEEGLVFRSTDNGYSFPKLTAPSNVTLFGLVIAKGGAIIVYGVAGACFRTTDGGNSWTAVELGTQDNLTASCVLPSGTILIAGGAGLLFVSRDNGASFSRVPGDPAAAVSDLVTSDGSIVLVGALGVTRASEKLIES